MKVVSLRAHSIYAPAPTLSLHSVALEIFKDAQVCAGSIHARRVFVNPSVRGAWGSFELFSDACSGYDDAAMLVSTQQDTQSTGVEVELTGISPSREWMPDDRHVKLPPLETVGSVDGHPVTGVPEFDAHLRDRFLDGHSLSGLDHSDSDGPFPHHRAFP